MNWMVGQSTSHYFADIVISTAESLYGYEKDCDSDGETSLSIQVVEFSTIVCVGGCMCMRCTYICRYLMLRSVEVWKWRRLM